jgi:hypothetical protein
MSSHSRTLYMLKCGEDSLTVNRTIKLIGEGPFVVLVTDRNYEVDPTGRSETVVSRNGYESIDDAVSELELQINLSIADHFIHNPSLID